MHLETRKKNKHTCLNIDVRMFVEHDKHIHISLKLQNYSLYASYLPLVHIRNAIRVIRHLKKKLSHEFKIKFWHIELTNDDWFISHLVDLNIETLLFFFLHAYWIISIRNQHRPCFYFSAFNFCFVHCNCPCEYELQITLQTRYNTNRVCSTKHIIRNENKIMSDNTTSDWKKKNKIHDHHLDTSRK